MNIRLCRVVLLVTTDDTKDTRKIMLKDFYLSFFAVCFTLLGFWLIVDAGRGQPWPDVRGQVRSVVSHR